jgi:hypothetical protein
VPIGLAVFGLAERPQAALQVQFAFLVLAHHAPARSAPDLISIKARTPRKFRHGRKLIYLAANDVGRQLLTAL